MQRIQCIVCEKSSLDIYPYYSSTEIIKWEKDLYKDGVLIKKRYVNKDDYYSVLYPDLFTIKESGAYYIKVYPSGQKECVIVSDTANFKFVNSSFVLPVDTAFTCSESIVLYSKRTSDLVKSYQWTYKDKIVGNGFYLRTAPEEGIYTVENKYTETCSSFEPIVLEKKLRPTIRFSESGLQDSLINACKGENISLALSDVDDLHLGSDPRFTVEWYNGKQKISNNKEFLAIEQSGNYFVKTKYKECEATSNTISVQIKEVNNQISPAFDSLGVCINGGFQLLEAGKGTTGYIYQWFKNGLALEESSSSLKATQTGIYKALIQSDDCPAFTHNVKIYASNQLPTATISGDTTLNIGDTANLKLSFTSSPPFTYKLSNNQEGTSEKSIIIHPVKIQEESIFKLASVKNACGEGTVSGEAKVIVIILGNEPLIGNKITVAPVPAEAYCEIIIDLPNSQEVSYQLLDMKGQQLSEKNLGKVMFKKQYLNLNNLTAGEYLIKVQVGKDLVTRKLIKF